MKLKFFLLAWYKFNPELGDYSIMNGGFNIVTHETKYDVFAENDGNNEGKLEIEEITFEEALTDYKNEFWYYNDEIVDLEKFVDSFN